MSDEELPEAVSNEDTSSSLISEAPKLSFAERVKNFRPESILPTTLRNKLGGFSRISASVLLLLILSGVAYGGNVVLHDLNQPRQHFTAKVVPFAILSTTPNSGDQDLNRVSKIVINFNKPVDPSKLKGDFWIKPAVEGSFSQNSSNQAIFTPTVPLAQGVEYNVMIHGEFTSKSGLPLGADYNLNFVTATPNNSVIFTTASDRGAFGSSPVGTDQTYTLSVGNSVDPAGEVDVFKANQTQLLTALKDGEAWGVSRSDGPVSVDVQAKTDQMPLVQTQKGLSDGQTLKLNLPIGEYVIAAIANNVQVGYTWLVVTDLGVALRQDDQKIVLAVSSLSSSQPATADIQIYDFDHFDSPLATSTITGVGSIDFPYSQTAQWLVAQSGEDTAVVPIEATNSLADLRVDQNFSSATQSFGLTNKPTYYVGEKVKFSGFVYTDNDVHYTPVANRSLQVFVATDKSAPHLADATLSTDSTGRVSGSFSVDDSWISDSKSANLNIYVKDDSSDLDWLAGSQLASFTVVKSSMSANQVEVSFPKTDYLATDPITAKVIVRTKDGVALSNGKVTVNIFATPYNEASPTTPRVISDSPGESLNPDPVEVSLDPNGAASIPIDSSKLPSGSSQVLTVQASTDPDASGNVAAGGASVVVHQGLAKLVYGPNNQYVAPGGTVVAKLYALTLNGTPIANATIQYSLTGGHWNYDASGNSTYAPSQISSGAVKSDATGLVQISANIGTFGSNKGDASQMDFTAFTGDSNNDKIEAAPAYFFVRSPGDPQVGSELQLSKISLSGATTNVAVGQTLNLIVNVPHDIHALVTIDRGRIYKYEAVDFKEGDNSYPVVVTPDMLPSFNLSFSYFDSDGYQVEGHSFSVFPSIKESSVQITPGQSTFSAGDTGTFQIKTTDATGNPVAANLIVGAVEENMFSLNNQPAADVLSLYQPRETSISSSSSLTGIGSGNGGGCGPGGNGYDGSNSFLNPTGKSIYWNPALATGNDGIASVQMKLPKGTWRIFVYSADQSVDFGSSYIDVTAK